MFESLTLGYDLLLWLYDAITIHLILQRYVSIGAATIRPTAGRGTWNNSECRLVHCTHRRYCECVVCRKID